jgi:hypothetical protein
MIIYAKSLWGLPLAFSFSRGSPLVRSLLLPAVSVLMTVLLMTYTCRHVVVPLAESAAEGDEGAEVESDST